jgi:ABC-type Na+ efflux pump permease subunit
MGPFERLRAVRRGFLARHEARLTAAGRQRGVYSLLAVLLDLAAGMVLLLALVAPAREATAAVPFALVVAALLSLVPAAAAVGAMIPAIAGEKVDGTLESLMLTPVNRGDLLWAKLLARTGPVRVFMYAASPAFAACAATLAVLVARDGPSGPEAAVVLVFAGGCALLAAAAWWGVVFLEAHCAGAVALYCSGWGATPLKASLLAYPLVFLPALLLGCLYGVGILFPLVAGPILLAELNRKLDRFVLGG